MSEPAVGSGPEHGANVRDGMARAAEVRKRWLASIVAGEVSIEVAAQQSWAESQRALRALRLIGILEARSGWTTDTAREALLRNGFGPRDTIRTIRSDPSRLALFGTLVESEAARWRARPELPPGWPFRGKLEALVTACGAPVPAALTATPEPEPGGTGEPDPLDELELLMEGDG